MGKQVIIQYHPDMDKAADEICNRGAARAGAIVVVPLLGTMALMANEVYMVVRIGKVYGVEISETAAAGFLMSLGAAFAGQTLATLFPIPLMQVPIGVGVTYAVGKAAQAWIKAGMPDDAEEIKREFGKLKDAAMKRVDELKNHHGKDTPLGDESKKF